MDQTKAIQLLQRNHIRQSVSHQECVFQASYWLHGPDMEPTSILVIKTGSCRISINITADELRRLGLMLVDQAGQVDAMLAHFTPDRISEEIKRQAAIQLEILNEQ